MARKAKQRDQQLTKEDVFHSPCMGHPAQMASSVLVRRQSGETWSMVRKADHKIRRWLSVGGGSKAEVRKALNARYGRGRGAGFRKALGDLWSTTG